MRLLVGVCIGGGTAHLVVHDFVRERSFYSSPRTILDWVDGRIPVDVSVEQTLDFSAETPGVLSQDAANRVTFCRNPRHISDYAFSPTCNPADL
jgi:hypothetical protein